MKKIVRLTESDLSRIVRRVINEQPTPAPAVKKPPYIQLYYGNIIVGIRYDANQDIVYVQGSSKMPDGNMRGL